MLLNIQPVELEFPFELMKQISCYLQLLNNTDNYVAFKVKTTNPKKYCVRPHAGVVLPRYTCDIVVTMQAQKEAPVKMQCKDRFLLESVIAPDGSTTQDITPELFSKEAGHVVEEQKLRVVYVSPPPISEGFEECGPPSGSVSENGHFSTSNSGMASRAFAEQYQKPSKVGNMRKDDDHGTQPITEDALMSGQSRPENGPKQYLCTPQTINRLESTAKEAQNKIQALEVALQETKLVVQRFSQQIENIKTNLGI